MRSKTRSLHRIKASLRNVLVDVVVVGVGPGGSQNNEILARKSESLQKV